MAQINAQPSAATMPAPISDLTEESIRAACQNLYNLVKDYGPELPPFETMIADMNEGGKDGPKRLLARAASALVHKAAADKAKRLNALRDEVKGVITPYMAEADAMLQEWLGLSDRLKAAAPLPPAVEIPVGAFDAVIPSSAGTTNLVLKELGYALAPDAKEKGKFNVRLPFPKGKPATQTA